MSCRAKPTKARLSKALIAACAVVMAFCVWAVGSDAAYGLNRATANSAPVSTQAVSTKKSFSDLPTAYPSLYCYSPDACWNNVYDENKVINWSEAGNYVGQTVTVEGDVFSIVYAGSSNGSPYFYNFGGEAYAPGGFAIVIWSQDLNKFDQNALSNEVAWSESGQPLAIKMRVSGVVEMYNGRPQITARHGSQMACQMQDGEWFNYLSGSEIDALMAACYR